MWRTVCSALLSRAFYSIPGFMHYFCSLGQLVVQYRFPVSFLVTRNFIQHCIKMNLVTIYTWATLRFPTQLCVGPFHTKPGDPWYPCIKAIPQDRWECNKGQVEGHTVFYSPVPLNLFITLPILHTQTLAQTLIWIGVVCTGLRTQQNTFSPTLDPCLMLIGQTLETAWEMFIISITAASTVKLVWGMGL